MGATLRSENADNRPTTNTAPGTPPLAHARLNSLRMLHKSHILLVFLAVF